MADNGDAHFEEYILVFLVGLSLDLLRELDYWLKLGVVLLVLHNASSVHGFPVFWGGAIRLSASIAKSGRLTRAVRVDRTHPGRESIGGSFRHDFVGGGREQESSRR